MNNKQKLIKLNEIVDKFTLPENHILKRYQQTSESYFDGNESRSIYFISNYIALIQEYLFSEGNYHELMMVMNGLDEITLDIRTHVRPNDAYTRDVYDQTLSKIYKNISKLKAAGISIDRYEEDLALFLDSDGNRPHEGVFFAIQFLELLDEEIEMIANTVPEPVTPEVANNFILNLIYYFFSCILSSSTVEPDSPQVNNTHQAAADDVGDIRYLGFNDVRDFDSSL